MKTWKPSIFLILVFLFLLPMFACTILIGGPDYPGHTIPITTEAVGELQTSIDQAVSQADDSGQVVLIITESQLSSYFALRLQEQNDPYLINPQVYLQNSQIQIYGTFTQGYFQATADIILGAGVDESGQVVIELISADFGPFPVPAEILDTVTKMIEEAFTGSVGPVATGIRITSITIANGTMTIYGQIR